MSEHVPQPQHDGQVSPAAESPVVRPATTDTPDVALSDAPVPVAGAPTELPGPTPTEMRAAMGTFATGVTVVTGVGEDGTPVGFACQSFASVSLEPPLVLFCADHRGRAWPTMRPSGRFTVNVLAEAQAEVCDRFGSRFGRKFEDLEWDRSPIGTPSLRGAMMRVHAQVHDVVVAGDHDIVIGRVLALDTTADSEPPMVFYRGRFGIEDPNAVRAPSYWGWGDHWG